MQLSVLCVTKAEPRMLDCVSAIELLADVCQAECVLVADGKDALLRLKDFGHVARASKMLRILQMDSQGYLESIHDDAVRACHGEYVFRLDDDESPSPELIEWLAAKGYHAAAHWRFPRQHLWGSPSFYLTNGSLWPDFQTRLSLKPLALGRDTVHAPSPHGRGELGAGTIRHWKFLLRTPEERQQQATRYETLRPGAGMGKFLQFQLPEVAFGADIAVLPVNEVEVPS